MAKRSRRPARTRPKSAKTKTSSRRGVRASSSTGTTKLSKARRGLSTNPNYLHWIAGFQTREAARTGKVPTPHQVSRNKEFQRAVNVVLTSSGKRKHKATSRLAKALVALGVRDPSFRGAVGNSPTHRRR